MTQTREKLPILVDDLRYTIIKLLLNDGAETGGSKAAIVVIPAPTEFAMEVLHGSLYDRLVRSGARIRRICYQVFHRPSRELSPIYDHPFRDEPRTAPLHGRLFIYPMHLNPAEEVWPELTRQGYYGELPQFHT